MAPGVDSAFDLVDPLRLYERGSAKWSAGPTLLSAGLAEMDFDPPAVVSDVLIDHVRRGDLGLSHPRAVDAVTRAFLDWAASRWGWDIEPTRVVPMADVMRVLDFCLQHLTTPRTPVIVPTPGFPPFLSVPHDWNRPVVESPMADDHGRWRLDLDHLEQCFRAGAELLILCNPHNPLGSVLNHSEMLDLAEVVDRHGATVFADEIHAPLMHSNAREGVGQRFVPYASSSATAAAHTVTGTSAGKGWNIGGVKCALMVLPDEGKRIWASTSGVMAHGTSTLGMWATAAAFSQAEPWLDAVLAQLEESRHLLADLVAEHLPGVRYRAPEATYLAWLDFRQTAVAGSASVFMREHAKVIVEDGRQYGAGGEGHVRLNFATSHSLLTEIVTSMGTALDGAGTAPTS